MRTRNDSPQNSSYGPGGDGAQIAYAIVDSALGRLLVAGTDRGICFAAMGEADATLVTELRSDYPRASIRVFDLNRHEDSRIGLWADALADYIAGRSKMPAPPMDIRGTSFQFAVPKKITVAWSAATEPSERFFPAMGKFGLESSVNERSGASFKSAAGGPATSAASTTVKTRAPTVEKAIASGLKFCLMSQ